MVALSQSLVVWLGDRYNTGHELPRHQAWTIRENKWRAGRYGLEAEIIRNEEGDLISLRRSIGDLLDDLSPVADRLGCATDLDNIHKILERGTSATRQREVHQRTGRLSAVVDALVDEMRNGNPGPLPSDDFVGGAVGRGEPLTGEMRSP